MPGEPKTLKEILRPRQFRIVELVTAGLTNAEIGKEIGTTEHVVKNYLRLIYDDAGCWTRTELAIRFTREKLAGCYAVHERDRGSDGN